MEKFDKTDAPDDLLHNVLTSLFRILKEVREIEKAVKKIEEEARKCPYAKKQGATCHHVRLRKNNEGS